MKDQPYEDVPVKLTVDDAFNVILNNDEDTTIDMYLFNNTEIVPFQPKPGWAERLLDLTRDMTYEELRTAEDKLHDLGRDIQEELQIDYNQDFTENIKAALRIFSGPEDIETIHANQTTILRSRSRTAGLAVWLRETLPR